jgi:hypothetical protein
MYLLIVWSKAGVVGSNSARSVDCICVFCVLCPVHVEASRASDESYRVSEGFIVSQFIINQDGPQGIIRGGGG